MDEPVQPQPPRNKGGRPKGSPNRPKWLLKKLRAQKKPRGRPPGAKNKPTDLAGFLEQALAHDPPAPPRRPRQPTTRVDKRTPEQRRAASLKALAARKKPARRDGTPLAWNYKDWAIEQEAAKQEAKRIIKIMVDSGQLDPNDKIANEAMEAALQLMREPGHKEFKLKTIRTVLEYTKAKPASKQDVTLRTAEDFLDELAAEGNDG